MTRVLMLGWELPPFFAGGVGVVAEQLTRALSRRDIAITYVMPRGPRGAQAGHMRVEVADAMANPSTSVTDGIVTRPSRAGDAGTLRASVPSVCEFVPVPGHLTPYAPGPPYASLAPLALGLSGGTSRIQHRVIQALEEQSPREPMSSMSPLYGPELLAEVRQFSDRICDVVKQHGVAFDVIHAHDWTTFLAGLTLRDRFQVPLFVHVHITEYDKSGGSYADPDVFAIEKAGMLGADCVMPVSRRIAEVCVNRYGVDPSRIEVVYNGAEPLPQRPARPIPNTSPMVLFLGRLTLQKGPDYFVEAAHRVLQQRDDVTFVTAGHGDMYPRLVERAAELGIGEHLAFAGFVERRDVFDLFASADVFVMPSVSEPFGIVPLEAMQSGVPVILSRQSGVAEVLDHVFKVDFWDVEALAERIIEVLMYPALRAEMKRRGKEEVGAMTWDDVAERVHQVYDRVRRSHLDSHEHSLA